MKRTAIWTLWAVSLVVAFSAGRWSVEKPGPAAGSVATLERTRVATPAAMGTTDEQEEALAGTGADALQPARDLVRDGRPYEALRLVDAYLATEGSDAEALFLLSDLRQMTGDVDGALDPLLDILAAPPTPEDGERARRRLDLLINAREQQLIHAGDLAALVAYFEHLTQAEPGWDAHRLKLARWLSRSGALDAAARLLREVGYSGVRQAEIDALAAEIELAGTSLPVEHQGGAMYTRVGVVGPRHARSYRFLIDTGATMTGLGESSLRSLGAERIRDRVRVRTAGGTVELPVYRISELTLGPIVVRDLAVLGFAELPEGADGLLGTDVLSRLSGGLPGPVGSP